MRDVIKESEKIQEEIKEKLNSDPDLTITKNELDELIQKLENKLDECGSHDLVSKFALMELLSQSHTMHNDEHPERYCITSSTAIGCARDFTQPLRIFI